MSNENRLSLSRRQLLGASAGAAALSLLPISAVAGPNAVSGESGLQSWVKRMNPEADADRSAASQRWVIRHLGGEALLSLGLVYRAMPQQPFELFRGGGRLAQSGISVATEAGAIDGLTIQRLDSPGAACEISRLSGWLQSGLTPGRYAILINSGPRRWRPDWSLAGLDSTRGITSMSKASDPIWKNLTLLSLDVRPA